MSRCCSLTPPIIARIQQSTDTITKGALLGALRKEALTSEELISEIQRSRLSFQLSPEDEKEIRRAGRYLGKKGLDNLVGAIRSNYRVITSPRSLPEEKANKPTAVATPQSNAAWLGTDLVGISGTGVTAKGRANKVIVFSGTL